MCTEDKESLHLVKNKKQQCIPKKTYFDAENFFNPIKGKS